jgi:hypothetical protein
MKKIIVLATVFLLLAIFAAQVKALDEIVAQVDVKPDILNLGRKDTWVTAYIELPLGYDVVNITVSTVKLNDTISAELAPTAIDDYDGDGILDLMVVFNRTKVSEFILSKNIVAGNVTLTITGQLKDGTMFIGSEVIKVRMPGDINMDGSVNYEDAIAAGYAFGSKIGASNWNAGVDENEDGYINMLDLIAIGQSFGNSYL